MLQLQMLLAALSAFLPLVAERETRSSRRDSRRRRQSARRWRFGRYELDDLALKLSDIRAEVEAMVAAGRAATPEELDASMARVRSASAAFRSALRTAEQGG